jgi:hypothetical protein
MWRAMSRFLASRGDVCSQQEGAERCNPYILAGYRCRCLGYLMDREPVGSVQGSGRKCRVWSEIWVAKGAVISEQEQEGETTR